MKNYKIAVAGTGYVGLSLGVLLSQHHQVVAVDIVQAKVDMIRDVHISLQYYNQYEIAKNLWEATKRQQNFFRIILLE